MIPLRLKVETPPLETPLVVRLKTQEAELGPYDARLVDIEGGIVEYDLAGLSLRVWVDDAAEIDGDVLLVMPGRNTAHRLIRARSNHNTLLITEQCDQLCIMCSQPPKPKNIDLFAAFETAVRLAPYGAVIGLSGGEPTLYKKQLLALLEGALADRPDLSFHILTNGQHFGEDDINTLRRLPQRSVLWGIPLYAADPALHDHLVGKLGAYDRLMASMTALALAGAAIELRTVVMRPNVKALALLANQITRRLPFISVWALMQLESIGYGRKNWSELFYDHSQDFGYISQAIDLARLRGSVVELYNFPLCTIPEEFRKLAPATISDWKRKFFEPCTLCSHQSKCSGYFEWHPEKSVYADMRPL